MIAIYLLALAAMISVTAPRVLPHAHWVYRAPGLALATWYAVIAASALAVSAALASLTLRWPGVTTVCTWAVWCLEAIRGIHGALGRALATAVLLTLAVLAARAAVLAWRLGRTVARRRREHAGMLRIVGVPSTRLGATVVESPIPAAYVVPGWRRRIVITTATLATLPPTQVAAVIAHERAHANGRHQLLTDLAWLLAAAFPHTAMFTAAHRQIGRLVEMRADEVAAAAGHPRLELARALVSMAEAVGRQAAGVPAGTVAATGGDALERVRRLLTPPPPLHPAARVTATAALLSLTAAPLLGLMLAALIPAIAACPSIV